MQTYDFEFINSYDGARTPDGTVQNDYTTRYFMRALYQRAISSIKFSLPEDWHKQYFKNVLFKLGFIGIISTDKYGVIPQICTLSGYGLYLQPRRILVSQPLVQFEGTIGEDCELIKLTHDYMGIWDIVEHYAVQLSICFTSLKMSLENSRLAYIMAAKNKAAAEALKIIAEKISTGQPAIVVDKLISDDINGESPLFTEAFDVQHTYITDKLLNDLDSILAQFDREVGIPTVQQKKERMLTDEIAMQNADAGSRLDTWMECLNESIGHVNDLFGLDITATNKWEEVQKDGNAETDNDRTL